jgi:hypothetical protein
MLHLTAYDFQKRKTIKKYSKYTTNFKMKNVLKNKIEAANFWLDLLTQVSGAYIRKKQEKVSRYNINFKPAKKIATFALLRKIVAYSTNHIGYDFKDCFYKNYPMLEYVEATSISGQVALNVDSDKDISYDISSKILKAPIPFNDKRFKVLPMHSSFKHGLNRSDWLQNEKGVLYQNIKTGIVERTKNSYNQIYLDTKIGFLFFFKNLPSITVSFYFDNEKNIYIQQIQSQRKDRGHYKIRGNWRNGVISYIQSLFPDYNLHLITGDSVNDILKQQYKESDNTISTKTLDRVKEIYDNIFEKNKFKIIDFNNFSYLKVNA